MPSGLELNVEGAPLSSLESVVEAGPSRTSNTSRGVPSNS